MISLLVLVALTQTPAEQVKFIPLGTPLELKVDGQVETVRYYHLAEFKLLMAVDLDLQHAQQQLKAYEGIEFTYTSLLADRDRVIESLKDDVDTYRIRSERMTKSWEEAENRYIEASGGPIWPYILAGAGAVVGIIGVTLYLSEAIRSPQQQTAQ